MIRTIDWYLPIRTVSEANRGSEHWTKVRLRKKKQSQWVWAHWKSVNPTVSLPCKVVLTRIAPRSLDKQENLPMAFKAITDTIADLIIPGKARGQADSDERIEWLFKQEKGKPKEYAIRIEIFIEPNQ